MSLENEKWTEDVLSSVEGINRAKISAGFYQKTLNRLKEEVAVSTDYILRMAAGLLLLITLNVFTCVSFSKNKSHIKSEQLHAFAKEYSLSNDNDNF